MEGGSRFFLIGDRIHHRIHLQGGFQYRNSDMPLKALPHTFGKTFWPRILRLALLPFHLFTPKMKKAPRRYKISLKPLLGTLWEPLLIRHSRRLAIMLEGLL